MDEFDSTTSQFTLIDYVVFLLMLSICTIIGLFFGYREHVKRKTPSRDGAEEEDGQGAVDYLLGGKKIHVIPVSMSLVASYLSGITLLSTPTEIYTFGIQYAYILGGPTIMGIFFHFVMIPVFYELKIVSMYGYLQRRFDKNIRMFGAFTEIVSTLLYLPICIYVPALAFNVITGIDVHLITPIVMGVCIFYTYLGGLRAVVWTDVIQLSLMLAVMILISVKGTALVGGVGVVWERSLAGGRIESPDFRIDPTIRHSFWSLFVGGSCYWVIDNTRQFVVQRYLSLRSVKHARKAARYYVFGLTLFLCICVYNGLVLFARYHDCDPLTSQKVKIKDQMMPFFVMEILRDMPGLSGVFIAGIFSAALSSLSSALNSMSAIILEDFVKSFLQRKPSMQLANLIMKMTVVIFGVAAVSMVYVVERLGSVLQLTMSLPATLTGCLFGIYIIGMFIPWIGRRATMYGCIVGSLLMINLIGKAQINIATGVTQYQTKGFSVEGCTHNFTMVAMNVDDVNLHQHQQEFEFHRISYLYYMPLGAILTVFASFIASFIVGFEDPANVDPRLLAPCMRKFFSNNGKVFMESHEDDEKKEFVVSYEGDREKL